MQFIVADSQGLEVGFFESDSLDIDVGIKNDFEFTTKLSTHDPKRMNHKFQIFSYGTEYGGIVYKLEPSTKNDKLKVWGRTWRGYLDTKIVKPDVGQDYKIVSGELHDILRKLIVPACGILFVVPQTDTGTILQNHKINRHISLLEAIYDMLSPLGYRLQLRYVCGEPNTFGYVEVTAVKISDLSEEVEFSKDGKLYFTAEEYTGGVNHLICLGKGELKDRLELNLYVQENGSIGTKQYYRGIDEIEAVYEYSSIDDAEKLREYGEKRLKELMDYKSADVFVENIEVEIGDVVSGREYVTGIYVKRAVTGKILRMKDNTVEVEYEIEGDDE